MPLKLATGMSLTLPSHPLCSITDTYYTARRHIDTASVYANEQGVGRGIKKAIDEGIVTRKDLFGK